MLFPATRLRFQSPFAAAAPYLVAFVGLVYLYVSGCISVFLVAAMAIGGGVGAVEIMARYRQAPVRAVLSYSGFTFVGVNVLASAVAWYLMHVTHVMGEKLPGTLGYPEDVKVKAVIVSGFGALLFLRSAVFKVRINETDVAVGPAALLNSLMLIADRGVDRWEAVARAREVSRLVARIRDPVSVARLLGKYSLALMQNIDPKSIEDLNEAIKKIVESSDTPELHQNGHCRASSRRRRGSRRARSRGDGAERKADRRRRCGCGGADDGGDGRGSPSGDRR